MEARKVWEEQRQAQLINIVNKDLTIKEFNGQRVVTFKDIDMLHERVEGTAGRNFRENKKHFVEKEDYYFIKPSDIQNDEIRRSEINNAGTYLITESGYLMLVKSLTDDLAWQVQRELVNKYFRGKELSQKPKSAMEMLELHFNALKEVRGEVTEVKDELNLFKSKYEEDRANDPLFNIECDELQKVVKRVATETLGGYGSPAYLDKSISGKVYSDVQRQIKREFGLKSYKAIKRSQLDIAIKIVEEYKAPLVLQEEIDLINNQIFMVTNKI